MSLFKPNLQYNSNTKIKMEQFWGDIEALIAHSHPDSPASFPLLVTTGSPLYSRTFRSLLDNRDLEQFSLLQPDP